MDNGIICSVVASNDSTQMFIEYQIIEFQNLETNKNYKI